MVSEQMRASHFQMFFAKCGSKLTKADAGKA
jgi:hypothetical protein